MNTYIYALRDPETKQIRYIGRSKDPRKRLYEHHQTKRIKTKTHHNFWIQSLLNRGLKAELDILETCDEKNWSEREQYWIANTPGLTNTLVGGEGEFRRYKKRIATQETKAKISATVSKLHSDGIYKNSYSIFSKGLQGKKKNSTSVYCGVFKTVNNTYLSQIRFRGKIIYLGIYKKEIDAAIAYDAKAYELFGITARLNFPH